MERVFRAAGAPDVTTALCTTWQVTLKAPLFLTLPAGCGSSSGHHHGSPSQSSYRGSAAEDALTRHGGGSGQITQVRCYRGYRRTIQGGYCSAVVYDREVDDWLKVGDK